MKHNAQPFRTIPCSVALAAMAILCLTASAEDWSAPAPEALPQVTVRWQGADQQVLIVEGAGYRVKTRRQPAEIIAIETDGANLLAEPVVPGFVDAEGVRYVPQSAGVPSWKTYQGRSYRPARGAAARVNVWNASPYYWDAHVLDIPLVPKHSVVSPEAAKHEKTIRKWRFEDGLQAWGGAANHCSEISTIDSALRIEYEGDDPYFFSPVCNEKGPLAIYLHLRSKIGGTAQLYYTTGGQGYNEGMRIPFEVQGDWQWHEIRIPWLQAGSLKQFRIDPPGEAGTVELDRVLLKRSNQPLQNDKVVRGEIVFHAFPDRLNIEFRVAPEKTGIIPVKASWTLKAPGLKHADLGERELMQFGSVGLLGLPGQRYDEQAGWLEAPLTASLSSGDVPRCWWVMRPTGAAPSPEELFREELNPLPAANFSVRNGRYLGYDAAAGLYCIDAIGRGIDFNAAYDNPNRRIEIDVAIKGDGLGRRVMCKSISHVGMLPATVLADENGFMLPTPILSCKNFAGEREEPDDSAYGNAFFPIELAADHEKRFRILHLFQNWGDHMLKQVSSIRFFHIYWHLSTGVSETTCFTIPWMKLNNVFVRIPDYRPYSGPFWPGQPQHDCLSWPGLLQYRAGNQDVRLVYEKTVFESITPNLARFTMHFTSSDRAARATATVMEIPQGDQTRTFLKIRYDWDREVRIAGDARAAFRWLNVNDKKQPTTLVYLNAEEKAVMAPITPGKYEVVARVLGKTFPFLGTHGMPGTQGTAYYNSCVLLRRFEARLGGKKQEDVFFSARYGRRGGNFWLTSPDADLKLKAGDFLEADLMLLPHAEGTEPLAVPERERRYYGTEGPTVTVQTGRKISEFPATVEADNEVAVLTVKGGTEVTPVIAKGFDHWAVPLLWVNGAWQNQQAHGGDGYQVNSDGNGKYRFTFLVKQRQGHPRHVVVTRARCSTGISQAIDRSGYLELTTDAQQGDFALMAPALFGPGVNTVTEDAPVVDFSGTAKAVRQIPLTVTPKNKGVTITIKHYDEQRVVLSVSGAATLNFTSLTGATAYRLRIDGRDETRHTAANATHLDVETGPGVHAVSLTCEAP